jgi:hypothetical protein
MYAKFNKNIKIDDRVKKLLVENARLKEEVACLREDARLLYALFLVGVDNWEGFEQALENSSRELE